MLGCLALVALALGILESALQATNFALDPKE
jgi:hypothetical protein